ncbi:MAG: ABC transporter ATP-binding protein [Bacilli bacterium]|nr:ABC transporter ATP-binding protein [Bacilli bacterium]
MIVEELEKVYNTEKEKVIALSNFSFTFDKGKFYAIMGHSGSGKSTLIKILGLMDKASSGKYQINGSNVNSLSDEEESRLRMENVGFIFQDYKLDANLRAIENVILPMLINKKIDKKERINLATNLLKSVGLKNRINHFPKEMSGGEQQRVCIARALANNPDYILADEPTGNLDEENEIKVLNILKELSQKGKCVIVVSHSNEIVKYADQVLNLSQGKLVKNNETE